MFSPKKNPKLSLTLCVVGVHGGVELLLLLLVLLTWELFSMCRPYCNDFQCESKFLQRFLSLSSILDLPYTYCLPLFIVSHSHGPFNEPEAHYTHRRDKCNWAAPPALEQPDEGLGGWRMAMWHMGHEQGVMRDFVLLKQKVQGRKWWEKRL